GNRPTSLNRTGRKHELQRITNENQRMLKSINDVQPVYNHKKWEDHYKRSEGHLKNCCAYPVITRMIKSASSPSVMTHMAPDGYATGGSGGFSAGGSPTATQGEEDNQKYVLKEGLRIGEKYYLLEMATDGRTLNVSAYDGDTKTSLELIIKEKVHRALYRDCNGDYAQIAAKLRVDGNRLVMDVPLSTVA
ncbi:unnamed protein product, partial [Polarella glacialis]